MLSELAGGIRLGDLLLLDLKRRPTVLRLGTKNNRNKDISPFGMPEESDWILNARSQFDRSLMRNAFIYNLSNQTGPLRGANPVRRTLFSIPMEGA